MRAACALVVALLSAVFAVSANDSPTATNAVKHQKTLHERRVRQLDNPDCAFGMQAETVSLDILDQNSADGLMFIIGNVDSIP